MVRGHLEKYVSSEHEGEGDAGHEGQVGEAGLGRGRHELPVIEAEQQAAGEQRQQAAVKHLSDQDDVGPVNCNTTTTQLYLVQSL